MAKLTVSITGKVRSCLFLLAALKEQGPKVTQISRQSRSKRRTS